MDYDGIDPGDRSTPTERRRAIALIVLVLVAAVVELSLGRHLESARVEALQGEHQEWAMAWYQAPGRRIQPPAKTPGSIRLVYLSNSHAMTGGRVSVHLQGLLDGVDPGRFEVLDLSSPGIFAPDMLQRAVAALDLEPDALILPVAYISFSDRMPLAQQAHSARSFFKPAVSHRLRPGFFLRNYDIGLMSETLVASELRIFRYRNQVRDLWERPLVHALDPGGTRPTVFFEVDEDQRWRFPEGYDNNLFQWRLYRVGRDGHLGDLRDLLRAWQGAELPVLAANLAIDFRKSLFEPDLADYALFRRQLRELCADTADYVDHQDCFPVGFATYDALHPTWHGARLHALDLALRLQRLGLVGAEPAEILALFDGQEAAVSDAYRQSLDRRDEVADEEAARRFDLADPEVAADLLRRVEATAPGSREENQLLHALSLRVLFWGSDLAGEAGCDDGRAPGWETAVNTEMDKAQTRTRYFAHRLAELQARRLAAWPLPPDLTGAAAAVVGTAAMEGRRVATAGYELGDGRRVLSFAADDGRVLAYQVVGPDGGYFRVDLLGDGSFILYRPLAAGFQLPSWVVHAEPMIRWGW